MGEVIESVPERQDAGSTGVAGMLRETGESLREVFRNPNLRRIQLAFAGSAIGDWAYATAVARRAARSDGVGPVGSSARASWVGSRPRHSAFVVSAS